MNLLLNHLKPGGVLASTGVGQGLLSESREACVLANQVCNNVNAEDNFAIAAQFKATHQPLLPTAWITGVIKQETKSNKALSQRGIYEATGKYSLSMGDAFGES